MGEIARYVQDVADGLERLERDGHEDGLDADEYLASVLEVVGIYRRSLGHDDRPVLDAVELLVAYGGPTVRVTVTDDTGEARIVGVWGSDRAEAYAWCPTLACAAVELAGAHDEARS